MTDFQSGNQCWHGNSDSLNSDSEASGLERIFTNSSLAYWRCIRHQLKARPTPSKKGEDPASVCHVFVGRTESRRPTQVAISVSKGIRGLLSKKETLNDRPVRLTCPAGLQIGNAWSVERCTGMMSTWTRMTCNLGHVQSKRPCHRIRPGRRAQAMQVPNPQT